MSSTQPSAAAGPTQPRPAAQQPVPHTTTPQDPNVVLSPATEKALEKVNDLDLDQRAAVFDAVHRELTDALNRQ